MAEEKVQQRRYVKVEFFGYAPIDLAIQMHLLGRNCDVNMVGDNMKPYKQYLGEYDQLKQRENTKND